MTMLSTPNLDLFWSACGAARPASLEVEGPEAGEIRQRFLEQPFAVLGRDPRADLCLDEWHVSRRHAYLQMIDGRWFCIDLNSQTGTHWDDGPRRAGWLDSAGGIGVGPFRLRAPGNLNGKPVGGDPLNDRVVGSPALPGVTLDFLRGVEQPSQWRMTRLMALVGQAPDCKVRLVAPSVSKHHAALLRTQAGVWVVDLLGREPIRVNGQVTRWALLQEGDELEIGQFLVGIHYDPVPYSPDSGGNHKTHAPESPHRNGTDAWGDGTGVGTWNPLVVSESKSGVLLPAERTPTETEVVERLLVPLVNEFRLMQQQMFDQFQQAMTSMFGMFTSMHREQTDLIRDELDKLQQLTQELHGLQADLARRESQQAPASPPQPAPVLRPEAAAPQPEPAAAKPSANAPQPPGTNDDDIHDWLTQRLNVIQRERQSSFQRIMNFLLGKS